MNSIVSLISKRPFWLLGMLVGILLCILFVFRTEDTRHRIVKVEKDSPCTNLTTSRCARKLIDALNDQDLLEIQDRFRKLNAMKTLHKSRSRGGSIRADGSPGGSHNPGFSPPGINRSQPPGSSQPQNGDGDEETPDNIPHNNDDTPPTQSPSAPSPPTKPNPLVDLPTIDILGIKIDPPDIDCIETQILKCGD